MTELYQERCNRAIAQRPEPAKIRVRDESSGEGSDVGGTGPYVDHINQQNTAHVVLAVEVHGYVGYQAHRRQLLERLVACKKPETRNLL